MNNSNRDFLIVILVVLMSWTVFLFWYKYFSHKSQQPITNIIAENTELNYIDDNSHSVAQEDIQPEIKYDLEPSEVKETELQNTEPTQDDIDINIFSGVSYNDLSALKQLYKSNPTSEILNLIIKKLLDNYEFNEAREYLSQVDIFQDNTVSIKDYIYTYINTLSITDPTSVSKFTVFLEQAKNMYLITSDDYSFYMWLIYIWNNNYEQWLQTLSKIVSPQYSTFVSELSWSITTFKNQKWAPEYYKDALVALSCMKNWYFSLANKLSVDALLKDDKYILPYQILAYSNFLTKNWEKAIEYFYELSALDLEQKQKCDFYIWISYYRLWNYEKSISTLNQLISNDTYKSDAYRYLLLNYQKLWDTSKIIQVRQKQLWTYNLKENDFKLFFDIVFYEPFSLNEKFTIFLNYKQMAYDFVTTCYDKFWDKNDTCIYGEVWLNLANWDYTAAKSDLLYLAENYPQANVFKALWDYYKKINEPEKAKDYYIKAASLTTSAAQKMMLESTLIDL